MRNAIIKAWLRTRISMLREQNGLKRKREGLERGLREAMARIPALEPWQDAPLGEIPPIDAHVARDDFDARNRHGITRAEAASAAQSAEAGGSGEVRAGIIAGFSTGTSGRRGTFLASAAERAEYIGQSIAKLLPATAPLTGARICLVLRADSGLYRDVGKAGAFSFRFLPLGLEADLYARHLNQSGCDTLIAPAHVFAALARHGARTPSLRRAYWGAEPMGEAEREWIAASLGIRPDPIWQATEGFLAAPCRHGTLHLNEDSIAFDWHPVPGTKCLQPIVTDLRRSTQPVVRTRLDDLVEFEVEPCRCRFGGRAIRPIAGRIGDLWRIGGRTIAPRQVADAFEAALGPDAEWTAEGSAKRVAVKVRDATLSRNARDAVDALGLEIPVAVETADNLMDGPKRRRVRWRP